jgi:hypothetical protein
MKLKSHNVLVKKFVRRLMKVCTIEVKKRRLVLVFDRGFARVSLMKWFIERKIRFLCRVPKNVGIVIEGKLRRLYQLRQSGSYSHVLYHLTEQIRLHLYAVILDTESDPMFIVSNWCQGLCIYQGYRRRMQIEPGFRDSKSGFGFGTLVLWDFLAGMFARLTVG